MTVATRTREIGLRVALGATHGRVIRLVLWQGLRLATIGAGAGLLLAAGLSQLLADLLFGISPLDPVAFGGTIGAVLALAIGATYVPARRAATVDPIVALRAD